MTKALWLALALSAPLAQAADPFYANPELQAQAPSAFALQAQARPFLAQAHALTRKQGEALVAAIQAEPELAEAIARWPQLSFDEQRPHLERVFALECALLGITPPELVIDPHSYPGKTVYFDFDPSRPGPGVVYLNPQKLAAMPPYASLAFLLHETRHSYQFQLAYAEDSVLAQGYRDAFEAQKRLEGFSFSDFLTLLNEYEAFQFGNYVLGRLTDWQVRMINMGTYASQFDGRGTLKMDLLELGEEGDLLSRYNALAEAHWQARQAQQ
ncbi:hypothetical protein [Ferrimonas balearica]|uniref:hypothetical protein n=1 Tax=Ferrimonas balearica TaxID=44012 RepID=UPI001C999405|nr:hypothetical protein [Ferrimonas balearica]MBY5992776.1 hypothetical protein [Ferrimonas balearica]